MTPLFGSPMWRYALSPEVANRWIHCLRIRLPTPMQNPVYGESAPVKTVALEDGRACEIHGDEGRGFEIRHGGRSLKSRFKNLDQAQMAVEMYQARQRKQNESADYIEEA